MNSGAKIPKRKDYYPIRLKGHWPKDVLALILTACKDWGNKFLYMASTLLGIKLIICLDEISGSNLGVNFNKIIYTVLEIHISHA